MKKLLLSSITIFLISCNYNTTTQVQVNFAKQYAKDMYQLNNWRLFGFGGGFNEGFDILSFDFIANEELDLKEARYLIVKNIEYIFELINSTSELLPYLSEVPFERKNIELGIIFFDKCSEKYLRAPNIASVIHRGNELGYAVFNEEKKILDIIHRETYEEAFKIVYGHSDECK